MYNGLCLISPAQKCSTHVVISQNSINFSIFKCEQPIKNTLKLALHPWEVCPFLNRHKGGIDSGWEMWKWEDK